MYYLDKFSRLLEVGDIVVVTGESKELEFGKIIKLTPKMVRVEFFNKNDRKNRPISVLRWSRDVLKLPVLEKDVILHTLKV